jgi:hypothetical protein
VGKDVALENCALSEKNLQFLYDLIRVKNDYDGEEGMGIEWALSRKNGIAC